MLPDPLAQGAIKTIVFFFLCVIFRKSLFCEKEEEEKVYNGITEITLFSGHYLGTSL